MKNNFLDAKIIIYLVFGLFVFPVMFFYFTSSSPSSQAASSASYLGRQLDGKNADLWRLIEQYERSHNRYITIIKKRTVERASRLRLLIQTNTSELAKLLISPAQYDSLPSEVRELNTIERPVFHLNGEFVCASTNYSACAPQFIIHDDGGIPIPVDITSYPVLSHSMPAAKDLNGIPPTLYPTSGLTTIPIPTQAGTQPLTPVFIATDRPQDRIAYWVDGYIFDSYIIVTSFGTDMVTPYPSVPPLPTSITVSQIPQDTPKMTPKPLSTQ